MENAPLDLRREGGIKSRDSGGRIYINLCQCNK